LAGQNVQALLNHGGELKRYDSQNKV